MGTEVVFEAGGAGGEGLAQQLRRLAADAGPSGTSVLVDPATVSATRAALAASAGLDRPVAVVGAADLTAPNLVDLLDDLLAGPGGEHLRAIAVPYPVTGSGWLDDVAVRRGLGCLQRRGLALRLRGTGPGDVAAALAAVEPGLEVLLDEGR